MFSKRSLALLAAPLLFAIMACGGGSDDNTTSSGSTPTGNDSPSATQPSNSNSNSSSDIDLKDCPQYANLASIAEKAFGGSITGTGTSTKIDTKYFDDLVKNSPNAIKGDMQIFADAFKSYISALDKAGVNINDPSSFSKIANDPTKLAQLEAATAKLDDPKLEAASNRITAYFEDKC